MTRPAFRASIPTAILAMTLMLGVTLILAACAHSADTRFFTLDPRPPATSIGSATYDGPALRVDSVSLPADLDRPELIRRTGANEMEIDDFSRWAAPLGDMARRVLTQDLASRLPVDDVIYPGAPKPANAGTVTVDVLDFSVADGTGHMDVSWVLTPADPPDAGAGAAAPAPAHAGQPRTLHLEVMEPDAGSKGQAEALSRLMAALADAIAETLRQQPSELSRMPELRAARQ
jgi:uncharacterized lipoprotein YmbA